MDLIASEDTFQSASIGAGKRVAVTGASGFIGGRLVELLLQQGGEVISLARRSNTKSRPNYKVVELDIADVSALKKALQGVQVVFHCAYDWQNEQWNYAALHAIIEACLACGCERLVHVSSFVAYEVPDRGELTEEAIGTVATGGYSYVKRSLDAQLLEACKTQGLPATIVQPTIVYGPGCKPWTADPADMLMHGTVILPENSPGVCNAVFVDDVAEGMILAATNHAAVGKAFLISGDPVTWKAFYEAIAVQLNVKGPQFWSETAIRRTHQRLPRLRRTLSSPALIGRWLNQKQVASKVLWKALRVMPKRVNLYVERQIYGPIDRVQGHLHVPDPGRLGFLLSRAIIPSSRARAILGYRPRFKLEAGMSATGPYLRDYTSRQISPAGAGHS